MKSYLDSANLVQSLACTIKVNSSGIYSLEKKFEPMIKVKLNGLSAKNTSGCQGRKHNLVYKLEERIAPGDSFRMLLTGNLEFVDCEEVPIKSGPGGLIFEPSKSYRIGLTLFNFAPLETVDINIDATYQMLSMVGVFD
jgi:hypothetical protein